MSAVLERRIIAVSPDNAFAQQLATALQGVGLVDALPLHALGTGELPAALYVVHLDDELARAPGELWPRLRGSCPIIVILARSSLAAVVDLMQSSDRIAGITIAEDFDPRQLSAMAMRLVTDDIFGLEKVMASGTQIHSQTVGDYHEKTRCMSQVSGFVEQSGVPRKYREPIEQCIDEMLMNALYDAPIDAEGKHIFSGVPTRTRITFRTEQSVVVQYAFDGKRFAISVRDAFGTLERQTVLRFLHKCLTERQSVDRRAGGAGLGLYLMLNASTVVHFNVLPGIATEAVCVFDVEAPKLQLEQFGFFVQRDAAGRVATGPTRRVAVPRPGALARAVVRGLGVTIAAVVVLLGLRAWSRSDDSTTAQVTFTTIPKGATIEIDGRIVGTATDGTFSVGELEIGRSYTVVARLDRHEPKQVVVEPHDGDNEVTLELQAIATVELDSRPTGAAVTIDGKPMGSTPLTLTSLVPGATVSIVLARTGYRVATKRVQVPARGKLERLVVPLQVSDLFVRVRFVSNPPGAEVIQIGQPPTTDHTYTPADVFVEADKVQRFTLTMPDHVPLVIEPFTPARGSDGFERGGDLVRGSKLRIEATLAGKVTVSGAPHCTDVALPIDCTLAPGAYVVEYRGPENAKVSRTVVLAARDALERFELGVVEAGPGKRLQPGNVQKAVLEVGTHTVTVVEANRSHTATVTVKPGATVIVN
jgi:hypothetical protein